MMRTLWYAGLLWLTGFVLFACQSGDLNVGQSIINPNELLVQSVDSVTIQTSTVLQSDSFATSSDPNILVGQWKDPQTGKLTVRGFTSLDYASNSLATQLNIKLDSVALELSYGFTHGDTLSLFNLNVYKLTQALNTGKFYFNVSKAYYETTPFLQQTFAPRPIRGNNGTTLVRFRLPDAFAQTFYAKLTSGEIKDATTLTNFLPGFGFICQSTSNTVLGFSTTASTTGLRVYYHSTDPAQTTTTQVSQSVLFPITNVHFTQFENDRTGTPLSTLKNRSDEVNSRQTDNTSFVAWGAGLQTRIVLPYLQQFSRPGGFADVNSALLVVGPIRRDVFDNAPPLPQLALYETNIQNEVIATVPGTSAGTTAAVATYAYDRNSLPLNDTYTFDLTAYVGQIIKRQRPSRPLLLTIPNGTATLRSLIQRSTLGNQQRSYTDQLKLKLYLTTAQ